MTGKSVLKGREDLVSQVTEAQIKTFPFTGAGKGPSVPAVLRKERYNDQEPNHTPSGWNQSLES